MPGLITLSVASITWLHYLWRIPREDIPRRPWVSLGLMTGAILAGLFGGPSGWVAALLAGYFVYLVLASGYPPPGGVKVGERFPDLVAVTAEGAAMDTSHWVGRRVLFKLYRGPW